MWRRDGGGGCSGRYFRKADRAGRVGEHRARRKSAGYQGGLHSNQMRGTAGHRLVSRRSSSGGRASRDRARDATIRGPSQARVRGWRWSWTHSARIRTPSRVVGLGLVEHDRSLSRSRQCAMFGVGRWQCSVNGDTTSRRPASAEMVWSGAADDEGSATRCRASWSTGWVRAAGRSPCMHVLPLGGGQSSVISASRMTAASLPPNVEENTVMPANLYSGGASFISLCIVPVRFVASKM